MNPAENSAILCAVLYITGSKRPVIITFVHASFLPTKAIHSVGGLCNAPEPGEPDGTPARGTHDV